MKRAKSTTKQPRRWCIFFRRSRDTPNSIMINLQLKCSILFVCILFNFHGFNIENRIGPVISITILQRSPHGSRRKCSCLKQKSKTCTWDTEIWKHIPKHKHAKIKRNQMIYMNLFFSCHFQTCFPCFCLLFCCNTRYYFEVEANDVDVVRLFMKLVGRGSTFGVIALKFIRQAICCVRRNI